MNAYLFAVLAAFFWIVVAVFIFRACTNMEEAKTFFGELFGKTDTAKPEITEYAFVTEEDARKEFFLMEFEYLLDHDLNVLFAAKGFNEMPKGMRRVMLNAALMRGSVFTSLEDASSHVRRQKHINSRMMEKLGSQSLAEEN